MADGLLGWPGAQPNGAQNWIVQQLFTGDFWYAPFSGYYLVSGCGGGGGGNYETNSAEYYAGGGAGGGLLNCPIFIPEGVGGYVNIGQGGNGAPSLNTSGSSGTATTFGGDLIIFGPGTGGIANQTVYANATGKGGAISGRLIDGRGYVSRGRDGHAQLASLAQAAHGADGLIRASDLSIINGILTGAPSPGGLQPGTTSAGGSGTSYGAGGGAGTSGQGGSGAPGCFFIAWTGPITR